MIGMTGERGTVCPGQGTGVTPFDFSGVHFAPCFFIDDTQEINDKLNFLQHDVSFPGRYSGVYGRHDGGGTEGSPAIHKRIIETTLFVPPAV